MNGLSSADKPLVWLHGEVRSPPLSGSARVATGVLLRRLQRGELLELPHSRSMPPIGKSCHELRCKRRLGAYDAAGGGQG